MTRALGIQANLGQFLHHLLQVLFVGLTIGMMRTVVPVLGEAEFGVPRNSFLMLAAFVVAFGVVKGVLNFAAGRWSERVGRKRVLVMGWLAALPIPWLVFHAPDWPWIVAATVLLGVNQGLTWSMTQTSQLDLTAPAQRGLTIGLNEFAGYAGLALAGVVTAYVAHALGARTGLLVFGVAVIGSALLLSVVHVRDTRPWALDEAGQGGVASEAPGGWAVFRLMSWRDRRLAGLCQAGLVEKFVDALVWVFYPVFLHRHGLDMAAIGWVVGVYGFTWGGAQLATGRLSDRFGRQGLNVGGMLVCGAGVIMMPLGATVAWWSVAAAVCGLGMAMLYPNLSAAVADLAHPQWRGTAMGIYRFWRDVGYAVGGLGFGLAAQAAGQVEAAFWFVGLSMLVSAGVLWWWGEETHPRFAPVPSTPVPVPVSVSLTQL